MAFHGLRKAYTYSDIYRIFKMMRDFVCQRNGGTYDYRPADDAHEGKTGIGWTLYDAVYASGDEDDPAVGDYIVVFSAGESGDEQMYYKIAINTTIYISMQGYTSWNATTHTGGSLTYGLITTSIFGNTNSQALYILGDLDYIHFVSTQWAVPTFAFYTFIGRLDTPHFPGRTVQTCNSSLSSGSGVSITVGDSAIDPWFRAGNEIIIFDGDSLEQITIITNDGVDTITANLSNSYDAGAKLSVIFPYIVDRRHNYTYSNGYFNCLHNGAGTVNQTCTANAYMNANIYNTSMTQNNWRVGAPNNIYSGTTILGSVPHMVQIGTTTHYVLEDQYGNDWRNFNMPNDLCIREK